MHILFTETNSEERSIFENVFKNYTVTFSTQSLNNLALEQYKNSVILCISIHSRITKKIVQQLPKLKVLITRSTGMDHIDMDAAHEQGITVYNIPTYASQAVAEYTFALLLALARKLPQAYCHPKKINRSAEQNLVGFELKGKTLGIIGFGAIGKLVSQIATGFDMRIIIYDQKESSSEKNNYLFTSFHTLLSEADIITFHVPLTPQTYHMINHETIHTIKQGAYLINTARGSVIDTAALLQSLTTGHIAGAALDVLEDETYKTKDAKKLMQQHNVLISPHNAFNTKEARQRSIQETITLIKTWIAKGAA